MREFLVGLVFVYWCVVSSVLIARYRRTRERGYLWFLVALVAWPIIRSVWVIFEGKYATLLAAGSPVNIFPYSLVSDGVVSLGELLTITQYFYQLVFGGLIIVAILNIRADRAELSLMSKPSNE